MLSRLVTGSRGRAARSLRECKLGPHRLHQLKALGARFVQSTPPSKQQTETSVPVAVKEEGKKSLAIQAKEGLVHAGHVVVDCIRNPAQTWEAIKKEAKHYWVGTKLLWVEIKIAKDIMGRIASGHGMTRRERMQLIRTTMDLFRLVPFAIFVIVPFMELLLPVALKLFPNMLPSTFQDKLKKEEALKMELQMRLAVAGFFQETMTEMAKKRKDTADGASAGKEVLDFVEKARLGEPVPNETVIKIAGHFKDELTLANINRPQLVSMCQYMGLQPFGADAFLRFQLRTKLRAIKEDDRRILWEGIESLTMLELREACNERGMRTIGLTEYGYKRQLQEWLDLSIQKNIPISLLIMSRAFMLTSKYSQPEDVLKSSMSSLDSDMINEVVLAIAKPEEESSIEIKVRKLESLEFQSDMIREERDDKEEAKQSQKKGGDAGDAASGAAASTASKAVSTLVQPILAPVAPVIGKVVEKVQAVTKAVIKTAVSSPASASTSESAYSTPTLSSSDSNPLGATAASGVPAGPSVSEVKTSSDPVEEKATELSATEIQLLGDLARGPSLDREKAELAKIEASVEAVVVDEIKIKEDIKTKEEIKEASSVSAFSSRPTQTEQQKKETAEKVAEPAKAKLATKEVADPSMVRMQSALNTMVDKLKGRIESTEKALSDKLPALDADGDGELSNEELKGAIKTLLKRSPSEKEAEEIVKVLDKNADGKVSVAELVRYAEEKRAKFEVEDLEAQTKDAQAEKSK